MLSINTDKTSLILVNYLDKNSNVRAKLTEKLSTGHKINTAGDNPAGIFIATGINSQVRANTKVLENLQITHNVLATADMSLNTVSNGLQRVRDLALQAANGILPQSANDNLQKEVTQMYDFVHQAISGTKFNSKQMLFESSDPNALEKIQIQVATTSDDTATMSYNPTIEALETVDISTPEAARAALDKIDEQLNHVNKKRAEIGTQMNITESVHTSTMVMRENLHAAHSTIMDTDYAQTMSELKTAKVLADLLTTTFKVHNKTNATNLLNILQPKK